jgi:hypothetical protein
MLERFFPEEEYTREKFDEAVKSADIWQKLLYADGREGLFKHPSDSVAEEIRRSLAKEAELAHERVRDLYGKSEKEATALNEEYDRLFAQAEKEIKATFESEGRNLPQAEKAAQAVLDFKKEKLGMAQENPESSAETK